MDIKTGREKMAIAWANPKAAGVSMNIDLVQSVAHILVRECLQAKIDVLNELIAKDSKDYQEYESVGIEKIGDKICDLESKLAEHDADGVRAERACIDWRDRDFSKRKEMNG